MFSPQVLYHICLHFAINVDQTNWDYANAVMLFGVASIGGLLIGIVAAAIVSYLTK
jgi:NhaP-type Na+/H+ or K+/H+ antiporter